MRFHMGSHCLLASSYQLTYNSFVQRRSALIQQLDKHGCTFFFRANGIGTKRACGY